MSFFERFAERHPALAIAAGLFGFVGVFVAIAAFGLAVYFASVGLGALGLAWPTVSRDTQLIIAGVIIGIFAMCAIALWRR